MITEDFEITITITGSTQEEIDAVRNGIKKLLETYLANLEKAKKEAQQKNKGN